MMALGTIGIFCIFGIALWIMARRLGQRDIEVDRLVRHLALLNRGGKLLDPPAGEYRKRLTWGKIGGGWWRREGAWGIGQRAWSLFSTRPTNRGGETWRST